MLIDQEDTSLPLANLLDKYLKHAPTQLLLKESRITQDSADALYAIQDLVYSSSNSGRLMGMFPRIAFKEVSRKNGSFIKLDEVPTKHLTRVEDQEVSIIDINDPTITGNSLTVIILRDTLGSNASIK